MINIFTRHSSCYNGISLECYNLSWIYKYVDVIIVSGKGLKITAAVTKREYLSSWVQTKLKR